MGRLRKVLEGASRALFWLCAIVILAMALSVTYEVISRYLLGAPTIWVTDVSSYMLVAVAFLGAGWTLRIDGHIRMELMAETFGRPGRRFSDIAMYLTVLLVALALLWTGTKMVLANYSFGWRSSTLLATPLWIPQSLIPLGALSLAVQSVIGLSDALSGRRYHDLVRLGAREDQA